jgi:hypothetical protein
MAANIFCCVCHARPYPELSLPEIVREEDDLLKLVERSSGAGDKKVTRWEPAGEGEGGQWFCPLHRPGK